MQSQTVDLATDWDLILKVQSLQYVIFLPSVDFSLFNKRKNGILWEKENKRERPIFFST